MEPISIERHIEPSKLDIAPFSSRCKVVKEHEFDIYVQLNNNDDDPRWSLVGTFPLDIHEHAVDHEVELILRLKL